jgi:hypothetical protein
MRDTLQFLANGYDDLRESFFDEAMAAAVTAGARRILNETTIPELKGYHVRASLGIGDWSLVPFIGVFDTDISIAATKGYYIVYILSLDRKRIYISLAQGWDDIAREYKRKYAIQTIQKLRDYWQDRLDLTGTDFTFDSIDLNSYLKPNGRYVGYEMGSICAKAYDTDNLPSNEKLILDAKVMIGIFKQLKKGLAGADFEDVNMDIIFDKNESERTAKVSTYDASLLNEILNNNANGFEIDAGKGLIEGTAKKKKPANGAAPARDYVTEGEYKSKLGKIGGLIVLLHERKYLKRNGIDKKVVHISKESNDTAPYDILSYRKVNGKIEETYIEVKTTRQNRAGNFFITNAELNHSKENPDKYYLYIISNLNIHTKSGKIDILTGDVSQRLNLEAKVYKVMGLKTEQK